MTEEEEICFTAQGGFVGACNKIYSKAAYYINGDRFRVWWGVSASFYNLKLKSYLKSFFFILSSFSVCITL